MDISVVIVTRNRAKYLAGALLSLAAQDFDGQRFEVIVGDNGSTDATGDVAASHTKTFANFHHFHDPRPGQLVGWHTALAQAQGEVVAFIDDDTRPEPGWLDAIAAVFTDADVGLATGPITPAFETEVPDWRKSMILDYQGGHVGGRRLPSGRHAGASVSLHRRWRHGRRQGHRRARPQGDL
jgi:glycosyltransferase involved in cell wall biosynthesis